jgi:alpha/beta superfamily hydrolase
MYTYTYSPAEAVRAGVLICPSLHAEFSRNYRREVVLARRLAACGFAVERFHYLGTGDSDGDEREATFDSMREDALEALDHLRGWCGVSDVAVFGTRWGGLIAASLTTSVPDISLAMWEPLLDASALFREAFRTRLIHERKESAADFAGTDEIQRRLRSGESVDVVGHTLHPALYETSIGRTLRSELGDRIRSVLAVQIAPTKTIRPAISEVASSMRERGVPVDIESVEGSETWWLVDEQWTDEGRHRVSQELIDVTTTWLLDRAGAEGAS